MLSSQRLGAFKPSPALDEAAVAHPAPERLLHVAASARDVRGALEADITVVRLVRPGHGLEPTSPPPPHQVRDAADLADLVAGLS